HALLGQGEGRGPGARAEVGPRRPERGEQGALTFRTASRVLVRRGGAPSADPAQIRSPDSSLPADTRIARREPPIVVDRSRRLPPGVITGDFMVIVCASSS